MSTILDYVDTLEDFLNAFFLGCSELLEGFVEKWNLADLVVGHNIGRFDNGVINAELMRLKLPTLEPKMMYDTIKLRRAKGFKKGQDNIAEVLGLPAKKKSLNWAEWQKAYATRDWSIVKERAAGDIVQNKEIYNELLRLRYLRPPTIWRP